MKGTVTIDHGMNLTLDDNTVRHAFGHWLAGIEAGHVDVQFTECRGQTDETGLPVLVGL